MTQALATPPIVTLGDLGANAASFARSLRASNLSPATQRTYLASIARFAEYLEAQGMPTDIASITREHVESFVADQLAHWRPATALNRYTGVQQLFKWAEAEGEIKSSPMARMRKPKLPEEMLPFLREEELRRLLVACEGKRFEDRRDMALIRMFIGTGARLSEITNLRWTPLDELTNDVDLDAGLIRVTGKGRRERVVYIGTKAVEALDRYLRVRKQHRHAGLAALWLARKGALSDSGVAQAVHDRGARAGLRVHAHQLRHSTAHAYMASGMQESDLMQQLGWRSSEMVRRYARSAASERGIAAARRFNPGDAL